MDIFESQLLLDIPLHMILVAPFVGLLLACVIRFIFIWFLFGAQLKWTDEQHRKRLEIVGMLDELDDHRDLYMSWSAPELRT